MRTALVIGFAGLTLAGCATTPVTLPIQATRYHYDPVTTRGTVSVEPVPTAEVPSADFPIYAAAVQDELLRLGYTRPAPGAKAENLATVVFTRTIRPMPSRRPPVSVGLGAGGYSGGAGLGGGVSFPLGGRRGGDGVETELQVRIRRGPDAVWEGSARSLTDLAAPGADSASIAKRLAGALFLDFPGESGRTIEVP